MADYIVKDTELTSVANAIRTAGGTNSLLSFPNGFVSAVNNISGGGSSDFSTAQVTVTGFAGGTSISMPVLLENEFISTSFTLANASITYEAILYKGSAVAHIIGDAIDIASAEFEIISGDAEIIDDACLITGNCTIRTKEKVQEEPTAD